MQGRGGFTLIEVLVALGLLVVIVSLAMPVALTRTETARARTAERILTLAPNTARGEAQRLGVPVALVLVPGEDGASLRLMVVRQPDPAGDSAADLGADPDDAATWPTVDETREMPTGTRLWDGPMDEFEAFEAGAEARADAPGGTAPTLDRGFVEDDAGGGPTGGSIGPTEPQDAVVLAWFLSDGSAMAGRATVVRLADGRVVRVRVEPLVGRLVFTPAPEFEEGAERDAPGEAAMDGAGGEEDAAAPGGRGPRPGAERDPNRGPPRGVDAMAFGPLEFETPEFGTPEFGTPEFERPEFKRRDFKRPEFDAPEFGDPEFDKLEFKRPEFDALEFGSLEFDDLEGAAPEGERRERASQSEDAQERTNPEPPQPR